MKMINIPEEQLIKELYATDIIDFIGDAISIQDTHFRILYQNDKAKQMIGDHVGKYCYESIEKRDTICEDCPLDLSFKDGKVRTVERRNPAKKKLIVEITTSVIRDSAGKTIAGVEVVRDITARRKLEEDRERLVADLQNALAKVKTLKGLLPICASCNKIRDDDDNWTSVDVYIREHSEAEFTHGYCPQCEKKHFLTDNSHTH